MKWSVMKRSFIMSDRMLGIDKLIRSNVITALLCENNVRIKLVP